MPAPTPIFTVPEAREDKLGAAFGTGLGGALQQLASGKLQDIQNQRALLKGSQFWQGLGFSPQEAMSFASADPMIQKSLLDRVEGLYLGGTQGQPNQMGVMGQQPEQGLRIGAAPAERRHREALELKRQIHEENKALKKQQQIQSENRPYLSQLDKAIAPAKDIYNLAKEMEDLWKTGKVSSGFAGKFTPKLLQNTETQAYEAKSNELATLLAGTGKGVATNFKIKMAQLSKPMLDQKPETQQKLLADVLSKTGKVIKEDEVRQQIIRENEGLEPANIKFAISERLKQPEYQLNLPDATYEDGSQVTEGDVIRVEGKEFERIQGEWKLIG